MMMMSDGFLARLKSDSERVVGW